MVPDLKTCPIEVRGNWDAPVGSVIQIIDPIRAACLSGLTLHSDIVVSWV